MVVRTRGRRYAWAILVCMLAVFSTARTQTAPSGCTDISSVPPMYSGIQYGAAIQGLFNDFGAGACTDCHTSNGGTMTPAGHLDLDNGVSYLHLVGVPSYEDAALFYVVPNHPEQSLLFQKINCDTPAIGVRMPFGFPSDTLNPDQQALIYDWIAEGAPVGTTDGVFRNGFDPRGFSQ